MLRKVRIRRPPQPAADHDVAPIRCPHDRRVAHGRAVIETGHTGELMSQPLDELEIRLRDALAAGLRAAVAKDPRWPTFEAALRLPGDDTPPQNGTLSSDPAPDEPKAG